MDLATPELVYNPYAFTVHEDPYETYRRLRDEQPVYWNSELSFWTLSRFEDVLGAFRDHGTFSSAGGIALESRRRIDTPSRVFEQMIEMDPPDHTVFRQLVSRMFTGRRVYRLEAEVRQIVSGYIDAVVEVGHCDLVADITGPFAMDVIAAVLGLPQDDRAELRVLADKILIRDDSSMSIPEEALEGMIGLVEYFTADLSRRATGTGEGLISDLVTCDINGRALTESELLGFCVLFVIAGHETTTKMVANAAEILSRHSRQRRALVENPELVPHAVEEVLRFHNSTQYMHRTLTRDIEIHGQTMKAEDSVLLLIGAANHDEREFGPTAGSFDIRRRPDRHLAFGHGAHFCLGAALARMEGRIALEEIHRRMSDYEVDHETKVRFHSSNVTGWTSLPMTFTRGLAS